MGDNFTKKKVTPINSKVGQETFLTHNKYDTHVKYAITKWSHIAVTGRVLRRQCQNSPYPSHLPLFKKIHEAGKLIQANQYKETNFHTNEWFRVKIPKREYARISVLLEALNWTTPSYWKILRGDCTNYGWISKSRGIYLRRPCHSKLGKSLCCLVMTIKTKITSIKIYRRLQAKGFIARKLKPKF